MGDHPRIELIRKILPYFILIIPFALRWFIPDRPTEDVGLRAWLDLWFAVSLLLLTLLVSGGLGEIVLRQFRFPSVAHHEMVLFRVGIGFSCLGYAIFGVGILGWLKPGVLALVLVLFSLLTFRHWRTAFLMPHMQFRSIWDQWQKMSLTGKIVSSCLVLLVLMVFLQTLAPPWDYDGLMYHLEAPKVYLGSGRITILPDMPQANSPLNVDMLFTLGLAFGSDTYARMIHASFAILLAGATAAMGHRFLGSKGGTVAVVVLLSMPIYPVWASWAYIDMAWALYEFLGLYALLVWREQGYPRGWLLLSALMAGFALGTKYNALAGGLILGIIVLGLSWRRGLQRTIQNGFIFGMVALLIGSPWYLRNLMQAGNPVYPLYFGGPEWPQSRVDLHLAYHVISFGTGRRLIDFLLLPWNIFVQQGSFATFWGSLEFPGFLFPIAFTYPLVRRDRPTTVLAWWAVLRFAIWASGSQQIRFLMPIFPFLSILAASVITSDFIVNRLGKLYKVISTSLLGIPFGLTLILQVVFIFLFNPMGVLGGWESKDEFLRRTVDQYRMMEFIDTNLPSEARVFLMWDGRAYYCDERCLPSADQSHWTWLATDANGVEAVTERLKGLNATHLMYSKSDAEFFLRHDPLGLHSRALSLFLEDYQPACTRKMFEDNEFFLFEITC